MKLKLNRYNIINLAGCVLAVLGFLFVLIGCVVLSVPEGIGVNTNLSPLVYVGAVCVVASLALAIVGNVYYKTQDVDRILADVAIYLAVIVLMFTIIFIPYTIFIPVLNPTNG